MRKRLVQVWFVGLSMVAMLAALAAVPLTTSAAIAMAGATMSGSTLAGPAVSGPVEALAANSAVAEMPCHKTMGHKTMGHKTADAKAPSPAGPAAPCPQCPDNTCPDMTACLVKCFQSLSLAAVQPRLHVMFVGLKLRPALAQKMAGSLIAPLLRPPSV